MGLYVGAYRFQGALFQGTKKEGGAKKKCYRNIWKFDADWAVSSHDNYFDNLDTSLYRNAKVKVNTHQGSLQNFIINQSMVTSIDKSILDGQQKRENWSLKIFMTIEL